MVHTSFGQQSSKSAAARLALVLTGTGLMAAVDIKLRDINGVFSLTLEVAMVIHKSVL